MELALGVNPVVAQMPKGRISPLQLFTVVGGEDLWLKRVVEYTISGTGGNTKRIFSDALCDFTERCLCLDPGNFWNVLLFIVTTAFGIIL